MRKEKEQEELWLQKEVIEFLRCASSTFFTAKRYEKRDIVKCCGLKFESAKV